MPAKKSTTVLTPTDSEIEEVRKWLASWLKVCIKRSMSPKPTASFVGRFGAEGELLGEFAIGGTPADDAAIQQWYMDKVHVMPNRVLDTWLFEKFGTRSGVVLATCTARGWVTLITQYALGRKNECYRVEDLVQMRPPKAKPKKAAPTKNDIERCRQLFASTPEAQLKDIRNHLNVGSDKAQALRELMRKEGFDQSLPRKRRRINP